METLKLRNLNKLYQKVNKSKRRELFYNSELNNLIVFLPWNKETDTNSICNGIRNKPYDYLINELNKNKGLVVLWSQVEGTSSDYRIYYDLEPSELIHKSYKEIVNTLFNQPNNDSCKYVEVKNGVARKLDKETIED